jgi:DNA-binding NarL/FixJ family response regulator
MPANKQKIIVVEDSPIIVKRLTQMLTEIENVGDIIATENYAEAVLQLSVSVPDVMLLDINLPDKSGIDLLRYMQSNHINLHVIILTNYTGEYYRDICFKLGASHFIDKSKEFETVQDIISTL